MANEEHLDLLGQGAHAWNQWREENRGIRPDLSRANLSEADFLDADLSGVNLFEAVLNGAVLEKTNLWGAILRGADLTGTNLRRAILRGADLTRACLNDADLTKADLARARLSDASLTRAELTGASLRQAILYKAELIEANLRGADLYGANLYKAKLHKACLNDADLTRVDFTQADLSEVDLGGATVGWSTLGDIDLRTVKGLDSVKHRGPSTMGIDTVYRSKGNIPEVFLRGTGVPDSFITFAASLVCQAIQFYSCFISYSSRDQAFAERLHADLQDKGVRCWFAPEDMKIGARIRPTLDASIRVHDKLLIILSENSVESDWVEQEVETALARERQEKRTVLFPIRLDDTVMEIEVGWPALVRNTRHIGDFRNWKDHDAYQQAFGRLLRDLKAEDG